jgi:hypothetical protein
VSGCLRCERERGGDRHGSYDPACTGCQARSAARSQPAFQALATNGTGEKDPLRVLVHDKLPKARAAVMEWWRLDHPAAEPKT